MSQNTEYIQPPVEQMPVRKGYTLDELRYQLALSTLKKEFCKEKIIDTCHDAIDGAPWKGNGGNGIPSSLMGKLLKGLSYADYFMVGFSVFKTARSVFSFFRKKKN